MGSDKLAAKSIEVLKIIVKYGGQSELDTFHSCK
jgi:hypothetical protein